MKEKKFIKIYIEQKKEIQNTILDFLQNSIETEKSFDDLQRLINEQQILSDRQEFEQFLRLLLSISNNYHRSNNFPNKIERILLFLKDFLVKTFSKEEIFEIFFNCKLILYLLFKNDIIQANETNVNYLIDSGSKEREKFLPQYCHFFLPEIRNFIYEGLANLIEEETTNYEIKLPQNIDKERFEGENDSYICNLIRQDLIDDFISHVNKKRIRLTSKIKPSIFETNSFLIDKQPSLIEYSAFFGSIQIFNYLRLSGIELTSTLWDYSIHSNNAEMIRLLEQNGVEVDNETYEQLYIESIKCHHNEIANYIECNFINQINSNTTLNNEISFNEKVISTVFEHCNYSFFPKKIIKKTNFFI